MRGQNERVDVMSEQTIFEACVEAVSKCPVALDEPQGAVSKKVVARVINTILDLTQSPRTVDELTAILREADAS